MIQRKGKAVKFEAIQKALEQTRDVREAYEILERFNLSNEEENQIISKWKIAVQILTCHGVLA